MRKNSHAIEKSPRVSKVKSLCTHEFAVGVTPIHTLPERAELSIEVLIAHTSPMGRYTFHARCSQFKEGLVLVVHAYGMGEISYWEYVGTDAGFRLCSPFKCACRVEVNNILAELGHPVQHKVHVILGEVSRCSHPHKESHDC